MIFNKTEQIENYEEKIRQEAEYWANECRFRKGTCPNPVFFYEDSDIEEILRGKYQRFIKDKATEHSTNHVLELGCGQGWLSLEVAQKGVKVTAYDISPPLIEMAKDRSKEYLKNSLFQIPNFDVKDLNKIVLEKDTFDVVMIWDALHHIVETERLLTEIKKSLKQGGSLVMIDHIARPNGTGIKFAEFLKYFLPWDRSYLSRAYLLLRKTTGNYNGKLYEPIIQKGQWVESPFEDVTGIEMEKYIEKLFHIKKKTFLLSFVHHLAIRIKLPRTLQLLVIRILKALDDMLVHLNILPGEYIFIWAIKE